VFGFDLVGDALPDYLDPHLRNRQRLRPPSLCCDLKEVLQEALRVYIGRDFI
jgi:hypothetical protein